MSYIITTHQLLGSSTVLGTATQQSLKQSYLAKKIAKLSQLLDAHVAVLDNKSNEINAITSMIDALHELAAPSIAQKNQVKRLVKTRSTIEKWLLSSKLMKHINDIRNELAVLSESALDTYDEYQL